MHQEYLAYAFLFLILGVIFYFYYDKSGFELKCIVSTVDGNKYCVREREKMQEAADLLAKVANKGSKLVDYLKNKFPDKDLVQRLSSNFRPDKIVENLPTSKYTAYSENKGQKMAFCLNKKKDGDSMIDEHTAFFVMAHEMAHTATKSIGHKDEFWENFKFLLTHAKEAGLHDPQDYKSEPVEYCSMQITDNPYYDYNS